ncbi:SHOCT domain-containing protein [Catellatospora sichuanensis]|uniref:SHOCT domain-containing protein n=1 Tax=Catellatospora sichuanensis TaxID=1969805 RepID=UPI001183A3B6|nr:SHOCT domain-containing protein [Catellatospora sichuanensis]
MTDTAAPYAAPAPKLRPAAVTAATWLLVAVAAAYLIDAVMIMAGSGGYPDRVREAMEGSGVDPRAWQIVGNFTGALPVVVAGFSILSAAVVLILALTISRGSTVGRILTWIATGFALLCNVCGLGSAGTPAFSSIAYVNASSRDRSGVHVFAQRLPDGYPDWYRYGSLALFTLGALALITATVLLAMPAANAYFRRTPRFAPSPYGAPAGYPAPGHPAGPYPAAQYPAAPYPAAQYPAAPLPGTPVPAAAPPAPRTPEQVAEELATLERRRERGELTDEQYAAERARLNG